MVGIGKRFQLGVVAGLAILAAGCNNPFVAGVGSGVDRDVPEVRITVPANGFHVRGALTLFVQWNDDKGVTGGRVTIPDQNRV